MPVKIAVFASGNGTNAEKLIRHFSGNPDMSVSLVLCNNAQAFVLKRAEKLNIKSMLISNKDLNQTVLENLKAHSIDFLILAGFLKLIPKCIIEAYPNKIINLHPALLPKYGGKGMYGNNVHKAVLNAGENQSGITIHYVNQHYDEGQIIAQYKCPVLKHDTINSLSERIHELEANYFPKTTENVIRKTFSLPKTPDTPNQP